MRCEILRHGEALAALEPAWSALWKASAWRPATLHPSWVLSWWQCFGGAAGAGGAVGAYEGELLTIAAWHGRDLVGLAPLFVAPPRGGALRARELRLVGDHLVGAGQLILAAPGEEGRVRDVVVEALASEGTWDLLDVTLASRPQAGRLLGGGDAEALGMRFAAMGRHVERFEARGRPSVDLLVPWERFVEARRMAVAEQAGRDASWEPAVRDRALELLLLLLRSPPPFGPSVPPAANDGELVTGGARPPDAALAAFIERAVRPLCEAGVASIALLPGRGGNGVHGAGRPEADHFGEHAGEDRGAALIIADGDRRLELLRLGADARATDTLGLCALRHAVDEGAARYEFADDSPLASGRAAGVRLRVFSRAAASVLERGYATIMRRAVSVADSAVARVRGPIDTIRGLRDAGPAAVTRAVGRVATLSRMHLYRGELFVWGAGTAPAFVDIRLFALADFEALPPDARQRFVERLELDEGFARQKWERGDLVVAAFHDGEAAGILWCARGPVFVPEIAREVKPAHHESYIHDVFVAPDARGRAVAPGMLEFLARQLRERDVYRAWALIERSNTASTRAFEKAAYASFADVIYARMGTSSRLLVRPPDPDAKVFLGLLARRR